MTNFKLPKLRSSEEDPASSQFSRTSADSDSSGERKSSLLERLSGSYMVDSKKRILLHGYLRIQIIRAQNLRNLDCMGSWACKDATCCQAVVGDVSDPYVTVHAGDHRLIKTSTQTNRLDPEWNEEFLVPIAHYIDALEFRIKDLDLNMTVDRLGQAYLPVEDVLKLDSFDKPLRTGIHRVVNLDDKPRHGTLEFVVEFVPSHMMVDQVTVPGTYFEPHLNSSNVKLYVNADTPVEQVKKQLLQTKEIAKESTGSTDDAPYELGRCWKNTVDSVTPDESTTPDSDDMPYELGRCWRDIYDSMCAAKHFIYVAGWSVDHKQSLLRGDEKEKALKGPYSPYIGELLKKKAEEGVTVNVLVWDDRTSNILNHGGVMGTFDEDLRQFCAENKINLCLAPIVAGDNNVLVGMRDAVTCTHHQKMVVCDHKGSLVGYVGGIDLTNGRYETSKYPLFRSLASDHAGDFYNGCAVILDQGRAGPRQPWHDIHSRLEHGDAIVDLIKNFEERWLCQAAEDQKDKLVDTSKLGLRAALHSDAIARPWSCQLFRSIDARTANLRNESSWTKTFEDIEDVTFSEPDKGQKVKKLDKVLLKNSRPVYEKRFTSDNIDSFNFHGRVFHNSDVVTDNSAQGALIHHIRRAEHSIYIENQYFLSSSHMWKRHNTVRCGNLVAAEITLKICQKIEEGERFAAYVLLPMWSEGIPESSAVQEILYWQGLTMESMYTNIAAAISRKKAQDKTFDAVPRDYLNFYCLGNRETEQGSEATVTPKAGSSEALLAKTRRHPVYVHSKMTIVDDAVALIGSANINQRSLDGNRDSELIMGYWQEKYLASSSGVAQGEIQGFRLQCWAHTAGATDESFREPSSLASVKKLNELAEANWKLYTQDEPCDMSAYLLPYPITVSDKGRVKARTENGYFPDTKAKILGADSFLPDYLTT